MPKQDWSKLQRERQAMPADILEKLEEFLLVDAYRSRPPYQQNDYLAWIVRAKKPATRKKRLGQMLAELEKGDVYMKMEWRTGKKKAQS